MIQLATGIEWAFLVHHSLLLIASLYFPPTDSLSLLPSRSIPVTPPHSVSWSRAGLEGDINKALRDGKPIIIEVCALTFIRNTLLYAT